MKWFTHYLAKICQPGASPPLGVFPPAAIFFLPDPSEAAVKEAQKEIPKADIDRWSVGSDAPAGRLRHLGLTVQLSESPSYWARPSVLLGYNQHICPSGGVTPVVPNRSSSESYRAQRWVFKVDRSPRGSTRTRGAYFNPYFLGEYAVTVINTRSGGLARILPSASLSSRALIQSGSAWNSFQFLSAASRLSCEMT